MEFQIEKNSTVPAIKQIQEQIKLSIAMGVLKRGDILPPIREVEKQTGINRGQIHRAYVALRASGLLSPAPGKRIAVAVSAAAPDIINKKCQELSKDIISSYGVNFAKTGDPNGPGLPKWPAFAESDQKAMVFDQTPNARTVPNLDKIKAFDAYISWRREEAKKN